MAKLFIANSTKQNHSFVYRLLNDTQTKYYELLIPYGEQRECFHDMTTDQIENVLRQHKGDTEEYIVSVKDIDRTKGFVGLIYSIGSPVDPEIIANKIYENDSTMDKAAAEYRRQATVAADKDLSDRGLDPTLVNSEIVQELKNGVSENEALAEGVEVVKEVPRRGRPRSN